VRVLLISADNETGAVTPLPLGLACVVAATERAGHEVRLLALSPKTDWALTIREAVEQLHPDVIGMGVRNIDDQNMQCPHFLLEPLREVVTACRSVSGARIVLGGAGYSIFPESVLTYLGADMGIRGEGEAAFPALLSWIEQGAHGRGAPALYLPGTPPTPRSFVWHLDELPLPKPDLWLRSADSAGPRIPVQSRRGCPLDCIYCSTSAIEGEPVRRRSPELVVTYLAELHECGFCNFHFVDNTFNLPLSYAKELCKKIIEAKLGIDWWSIVYPKWVDIELAELMAKAGCTQVSLGFESGSDRVLAQLGKRFNSAEVKAVSEMFADVGIKRHGFLLLGGPGETRETVEESLAFAGSLCLDGLKITVGLRIYPHTTLASIAVAEGVVRPDDDLLLPRFYLAAGLRDWLPERVAEHSAL
jgi:radical SAM superfamily enzyme YgiQ (UPF0313 family)